MEYIHVNVSTDYWWPIIIRDKVIHRDSDEVYFVDKDIESIKTTSMEDVSTKYLKK